MYFMSLRKSPSNEIPKNRYIIIIQMESPLEPQFNPEAYRGRIVDFSHDIGELSFVVYNL